MDFFSNLDSLGRRAYHSSVVKTVRATLFSSYLLLIIVSITLLTVFSYFYTAGALKYQAINALMDLSAKVVDALDAELFKMNAISVNIGSSELVKQLVKEHEALSAGGRADRTLQYLSTARLVEVMQTIIGAYKPVPQVNFYDLTGTMIGAGVFSQAAPVAATAVPWFRDLDLASGTKQYSLPHVDPLLGKTFMLYEKRSYISLYRTLYDEYRRPLGILEVKQFTDTIFRSMPSQSSKVLVFNPAGVRLYPFESELADPAYAELRSQADGQLLTLGGRELAVVATSGQSGWRVVVSQEQGRLLKPVRDFASILVLFGLLLLAAAVLLASRLAARFTVPLRRLHDTVSGLDWNAVSRGAPAGPASGLGELEELELAFQNMRRKLKQSMDEALEARSHELRATMLALQAQMDPHFVYNMLTTIGIMAEEGMSREIAESVEHLTHLLRYISSGKSSVASLGEELEYARRYLACMKIRFRDSLFFDIEVPPKLLGVRVPKLIVQPIIENAMKYASARQPTWHLSIRGEAGSGRWTIRVRDDGPGFEPGRLRELQDQIAARMSSIPEPSLAINGLGLLNISSRLRLFYGDEAVYCIGNDTEGGAAVVIGGSYEPKALLLGSGR
jgi:two-component system sensor histidine kinase YesM